MGMREWLDEAWVAYGFWSLMNLQAYYVYYYKLVDQVNLLTNAMADMLGDGCNRETCSCVISDS